MDDSLLLSLELESDSLRVIGMLTVVVDGEITTLTVFPFESIACKVTLRDKSDLVSLGTVIEATMRLILLISSVAPVTFTDSVDEVALPTL